MSVFSFDARLLSGLPHVVGISDLDVRVTASGTFLYTASEFDGGLGAYQLGGPTPILIDSMAWGAGTGTLGAADLLLGSAFGRDFLLAAGRFDDRAVVHETSASGLFVSSVAAPSSSGSEADWAKSAVATFGGDTFVFAHRRGQPGLEIFRLNSDLSMTHQNSSLPPSLAAMQENSALATLQRGETTLLIVASALDSSVGVYSVGAGGGLAERFSMSPGADLPVNSPVVAETVTIAGTDYLVLGSHGTSSISVFRIEADGQLTLTDHRIDDLSSRFGGLQALDILTANGRTLVTAGGADDGLSLFELSGDGRLHLLASVADTAERGLQDISAIAMALIEQDIMVFAAGDEPGISQLSIAIGNLGPQRLGTEYDDSLLGIALDDLLVGFGGTDVLDGAAGNDRLVDGEGVDFMIGGSGADVFVFTADRRTDVVLDFEPSVDRLDLSGITGINGFSQLEFQDLDVGTLITALGENIWLPIVGLSSSAFEGSDFIFEQTLRKFAVSFPSVFGNELAVHSFPQSTGRSSDR